MKKYIIGLFIGGLAFTINAGVKDSIGQKTVDGKLYILYKVEAKETLYSLSKQYNTTVDAIKLANDGMAEGLQNGATILIPSSNATATMTVPSSPIVKTAQTIHTVTEGETLYSIAKKNQVTIEEVKEWNGLNSNEISLGQELKVSNPSGRKSVVIHTDEKPVINPSIKDDPRVVKVDPNGVGTIKVDEGFKNAPPKNNPEMKPVSRTTYTIDTSLYGEEVTETKIVQKIGQVGIDQTKNLAQMKGVKVGTILMLVNPSNNKATFVRVISGDDTETIKVTNSVYSALDLLATSESKLKVSYTK